MMTMEESNNIVNSMTPGLAQQDSEKIVQLMIQAPNLARLEFNFIFNRKPH